ncbi:hypothetical protein BOTBODRAFT_110477 [Botryobasidium botryosum FD-172 SS1]|uniref:Protein kinase domain-containing protein n=1 Tax=Botryobasidium botryosum (strain FD-172 SS1) TaxID=930990 RepID=A0A067MEA5_BOTB1|nr:hypothetical protein BOTBODRAFT_110477 [Botryobasidium botryosum FD-172 SS1]
MLAQPSSARNVLIKPLSQLYDVLRCYPIDTALDGCEVALSESRVFNSGGFADCWQGLFLGRYKVAMKTPRGRFEEEVRTRRLEREAKVWSHLSHPNVLPFLGLCELDSTSFLVSPWMENGDALEFVQKRPDADCLQLVSAVAKGLEYLHTFEPPVIHGDLRGPNILISEFGNAYIADFGLSELNIEGYNPNYSTPWLIAGHPRWQAPETINANTKEEARRTLATDIFAFGRVMLELFTKKVPLSSIDADFAVMIMVMKGEFPERPCDEGIEDRGLSDDMWELMLECWAVDPSQRPDARSIVVRLSTALETRSERVSSPRPTKRLRISEELAE